MFGVFAKTFYVEKIKVDPKKMVSVSIMFCIVKKFDFLNFFVV